MPELLLNIIMIIGAVFCLGFICLVGYVIYSFFKMFIEIACMLIDPEYPRSNKNSKVL